MKRTVNEILNEAKQRNLGELNKRELINLGILFALEDIKEEIRKISNK